jgi:hypothetical protein
MKGSMVELLTDHFGEIVVGFVLSIFAWSFRSWSDTVKRVAAEFSAFRLDMERRLVKLETKMQDVERLCQENKTRHDKLINGRKR